MGQFSWFTQDTKVQIFNDWDVYGDKQTIHMVDPRDGHDYKEESYEGYGCFGGRDFYELLADINKDLIIKLNYCDDEDLKILDKKFEDLTKGDINSKRKLGIELWFDYIESSDYNGDRRIPSLSEGMTLFSPILVENYEQWTTYSYPFSHPKSDPDQGWHMETDDDEEEENED